MTCHANGGPVNESLRIDPGRVSALKGARCRSNAANATWASAVGAGPPKTFGQIPVWAKNSILGRGIHIKSHAPVLQRSFCKMEYPSQQNTNTSACGFRNGDVRFCAVVRPPTQGGAEAFLYHRRLTVRAKHMAPDLSRSEEQCAYAGRSPKLLQIRGLHCTCQPAFPQPSLLCEGLTLARFCGLLFARCRQRHLGGKQAREQPASFRRPPSPAPHLNLW
jgi:hypothetical protein